MLPATARSLLFATLFMLVARAGLANDSESKPAKRTFEQHVLPIFRAKCVACHSGERPKAGLDLTSHRTVMLGGYAGPVVRRAAAESSLLWERIASGEMPPKDTKLTADEKGVIRHWIREAKLHYRPPLPFVAFLGPDGSGKSSVIEGFSERLKVMRLKSKCSI